MLNPTKKKKRIVIFSLLFKFLNWSFVKVSIFSPFFGCFSFKYGLSRMDSDQFNRLEITDDFWLVLIVTHHCRCSTRISSVCHSITTLKTLVIYANFIEDPFSTEFLIFILDCGVWNRTAPSSYSTASTTFPKQNSQRKQTANIILYSIDDRTKIQKGQILENDVPVLPNHRHRAHHTRSKGMHKSNAFSCFSTLISNTESSQRPYMSVDAFVRWVTGGTGWCDQHIPASERRSRNRTKTMFGARVYLLWKSLIILMLIHLTLSWLKEGTFLCVPSPCSPRLRDRPSPPSVPKPSNNVGASCVRIVHRRAPWTHCVWRWRDLPRPMDNTQSWCCCWFWTAFAMLPQKKAQHCCPTAAPARVKKWPRRTGFGCVLPNGKTQQHTPWFVGFVCARRHREANSWDPVASRWNCTWIGEHLNAGWCCVATLAIGVGCPLSFYFYFYFSLSLFRTRTPRGLRSLRLPDYCCYFDNNMHMMMQNAAAVIPLHSIHCVKKRRKKNRTKYCNNIIIT